MLQKHLFWSIKCFWLQGPLPGYATGRPLLDPCTAFGHIMSPCRQAVFRLEYKEQISEEQITWARWGGPWRWVPGQSRERRDLNMSRVKGERTKCLGKLMCLDLGKQLNKGISQSNNNMPTITAINYTKKGEVGYRDNWDIGVGTRGARGCWHAAQMKSYRTTPAVPVVSSPLMLCMSGPTHRCSWRFSLVLAPRCTLLIRPPPIPLVWGWTDWFRSGHGMKFRSLSTGVMWVQIQLFCYITALHSGPCQFSSLNHFPQLENVSRAVGRMRQGYTYEELNAISSI